MRPRFLLLLMLAVAPILGTALTATAQDGAPTVEVIEVQGLIDGSVERSVLGGLEAAADGNAKLVVLQIDSRGILDADRTERMTKAIRDSEVPVASWVGPPGAIASNGAALLVTSSDIKAMSPGSILGPLETLDMRSTDASDREASVFDEGLSAARAEDREVVDIVEPGLETVVEKIPGIGGPKIDLDDVQIRFHKLDMMGRVLHAAAQTSIAYLLLLAGLFAVTFELFHPSRGPAGVCGLIALGFAGYGIFVLHGSPIAVGLIALSMVAFSVDLKNEALGVFTFGAVAALIAGSLLLFPSPFLKISPWILALGIIGQTIFMVSVMTRVMRDLKLVASGQLEVRDAHAHLEEDTSDDA